MNLANLQRPRVSLCLGFFLAVFALFLGVAPPAHAAGLLIADGGAGGILKIKDQEVHVTINNGIAVTQVTQRFQNTENRQVEALYTFPVPKGASVANFSMWIGGKEMVGEVVEKARARDIYNSYKRVRRDPGLLEQSDFRTFEMRIFPIAPLAEQKVQISYYQELDFDHDWATYVYPLATATRAHVDDKTTGKFSFTLDARSQVPIVALESPSHPKDFEIVKHTDSYYQASLEQKAGDLGRDVVLAYHLSRPHTGVDLITSRSGTEDGYFCLTVTAGEELAQKDVAMDYVFLLDVSGSMNDDRKLDLSRNALGAFVKALGEHDRFEVMTFNIEPHLLFDHLATADASSRKTAADFLASQQARGGTILHSALTTAYKYDDPKRPLNVVILSDGLTEQEERAQLIQLIQQRPANARVFCIGVGNDVDRALLSRMAEGAGGLAAFLSQEDNFDRQASAFRRKLLHPIAKDLKLEFAGVQVYDVEPQKLPNLYFGMPVRVYGRYKNSGPARLTLSAEIDSKPTTRNIDLSFPPLDPTNPEIERTWAMHKVNRLLSEADAAGNRTSALNEIVRLGEGYSIATEYTSFIVLENDAEYQRWQIQQKNAVRLGRDRAAQQQLAQQLESLRAKTVADIGPAPANAPAPSAETPASATPVTSQTPTPATPVASPAAEQGPVQSTPNTPRPLPSRSHDIDMDNGRSGGGAIDPVSGLIVLALAGIVLAVHFRVKRKYGM